MTTKHTPGPWAPHAQGASDEYCLLANERRWVIAFRQNGELYTAEQLANMRLIAAAPELLQALESVLHASEKGGDMENISWGFLRSVVAKAKGEAS